MHKYRLEKYKGRHTRHTCPSCGQRSEFVRYIDTETSTQLADNVGRCNREVNCGYHYTPKQYFADNRNIPQKKLQRIQALKQPEQISRPISTIPFEIFRQSLTGYAQNAFARYLHSLFDTDSVRELIKQFYIGTSNYWSGSTVFWQIDTRGRVRSGKIMLYDSATGRRVKEVQPDGSKRSKITWAHSVLLKQGVIQDFTLRQCLFGEHQLAARPKSKPVAIVEAEKTAIIASAYLPDFIWLACGSLTNLTPDKSRILVGRKVVLFPDLQCFKRWRERGRQLGALLNCDIAVSDLLERKASVSDKAQGYDLADYLVKSHQSYDELPVEIFVPPSCPNTEIAIARRIGRSISAVAFSEDKKIRA